MPRETGVAADRHAGPSAQPAAVRSGRSGASCAATACLQPRVSVSLTAARRSRFTRLLAGSAGIDPYTTATSDVYQDLFGLGTFTGKGIYDVRAFEAATGPAFPENHILSHDLIEGNFARCGLVSDIELIDELPARYNAYSKREHRWVRGDWQLLPWLGRRIPVAGGQAGRRPGHAKFRTCLPLVERWKVLDNLRRSLVPPALVLFFLFAWTGLPGSRRCGRHSAWPFRFCLASGQPAVVAVAAAGPPVGRRGGRFATLVPRPSRPPVRPCCRPPCCRTRLSRMLDAIVRTVVASVRDAGKPAGMGNGCRGRAAVGQYAVGYSSVHARMPRLRGQSRLPRLLLPDPACLLCRVAGFARLVGRAEHCLLDQPAGPAASTRQLSRAERAAMRRIARKTWDFFETFVGTEDNGLPPDNFQESAQGRRRPPHVADKYWSLACGQPRRPRLRLHRPASHARPHRAER